MIVYGDPSFESDGTAIVAILRNRIAKLLQPPAPRGEDDVRLALTAAGQLEQALEDAVATGGPARQLRTSLVAVRAATDACAELLCRVWAPDAQPPTADAHQRATSRLNSVVQSLTAAGPRTDARLGVKVPEGFAFYTLFPEQYAAAARRWAGEHAGGPRGPVLVVGVRSIGTTLSAVVAAALKEIGWDVRRLTVRPGGHPFDRRAEVAPEVVRGAAHAIVVDEGPGLSGSSMVAAAKALVTAGLDRGRISFFPGHGGEPGSAASDEVRQWWASTRRYIVPLAEMRWRGRALSEELAAHTLTLPGVVQGTTVARTDDLSGGQWRAAVFPDPSHWPPACAAFERTKYRCLLSDGSSVLWKFAGLATGPDGRSGAEAAAGRQAELARGGWSPEPLGTALGFVATQWIEGRPLTRDDVDAEVLAHVGRYLAACATGSITPEEQRSATARLAGMLYWNTREALGEAAAERTKRLAGVVGRAAGNAPAEGPAAGDGRLAPPEWLRARDGRLMKSDCTGHQLDHTIVGRQPLAWDVAGAIVEWGLSEDHSAELLDAIRASGAPVPAPEVLRFHRMAYAAFRMGQCSLCAAMSAHDPDEQSRLRSAESLYRDELRRLIDRNHPDGKS